MSKKKDRLEGIAEILEGLKQTSALGRNLEEAQIWEKWPDLAGMECMTHARPLGVRDGMLIVEVDSAVWMHKFAYSKRELVRRINRMIGRNFVTEIYLTLTEEEKLKNPQDGA